MRGLRLCTLLLFAGLVLSAQELQELKRRNRVHPAQRAALHRVGTADSPVISFHTWVNVGSIHDPAGQTGVAHMFEHMAFKGSETLGTRSWADEKKALDAVEEAYDARRRKPKGRRADQIRVGHAAQPGPPGSRQRTALLDVGRVSALSGRERGGRTEALATTTYYRKQLQPASNRAELWFLMESQRLMRPAFREFYSERDMVLEEYRQRVEGNPQGKMMSEMLAAAFKAHPYRNPVRRVAERHSDAAPQRGPGILRAILRSRQHHDGDRGRHYPHRCQAVGRAILRPHARQAAAARRKYRGTAAERSEDGDGRNARSARDHGGLQAAEPVRQGRHGVRPPPNHALPGTAGHVVQRVGAGEASGAASPGDCDQPGWQVSQFLCFPAHAGAGADRGGESGALEELLQRFKTTPWTRSCCTVPRRRDGPI